MIRKGTIGDVEILQEIMIESLGHWGYSKDKTKKLGELLKITADFVDNAIIYVEEHDEKIVGFFAIEPIGVQNEAKFYIRPNYIKTGIGKRLWHHVMQDLEKTELKYITIVIDANAIGFYEKLGFIKHGKQPSKLSGGSNTPIMRYYLKK